jgi:hypothetical protein
MKIEELRDRQVIRVVRDVKNPKADRRYRGNESARPTFEKGRNYIVREDHVGAKVSALRLCRVGTRGELRQFADKEAFAAVVEAAEPAPMSGRALTTYHAVRTYAPEFFIAWLVDRGVLSVDQFEAAWRSYLEEPDV